MTHKILISGTIGWAIDAYDVRRELARAGGDDVLVEIASPGGSVFDGLEMFNVLKAYEGRLDTHIIGLAASMASYLALAGETRTAAANAVFMIHNAWSFVGGDHNDMRERAAVLEGLSNVLAKEYANTTGKPLSEIKGLMDSNTYFFGEEIADAGFVHSVDGDSDGAEGRAGVIASAKLEIEACMAKVREKEESPDKIAAMLQTAPISGTIPEEESSTGIPAGQNITTKTEEDMSLKAQMDKDPGLKAEVEARDKDNYDRGKTDGTAAMQARINKTAPYLTGSAYPAAIGVLAVKVLKGESGPDALDGAVAVMDAQAEEKKSKDAQGEQSGETPAGQQSGAPSADGSVSTEDDFQASAKRLKGQVT